MNNIQDTFQGWLNEKSLINGLYRTGKRKKLVGTKRVHQVSLLLPVSSISCQAVNLPWPSRSLSAVLGSLPTLLPVSFEAISMLLLDRGRWYYWKVVEGIHSMFVFKTNRCGVIVKCNHTIFESKDEKSSRRKQVQTEALIEQKHWFMIGWYVFCYLYEKNVHF